MTTSPSVVLKYELSAAPAAGLYNVGMPTGARVLSVQNQHERVQVWALVNPLEQMTTRVFKVLLTGIPVSLPEAATFIGTVQLDGGRFVAHVFEVTP